ncbi:ALK and LTK ligand 2b [Enoplosus armatus]|uniref:ALK and LTK ligand 2b n=1 Tax=Enoplosus armatus TaxID=215367 RepID=UPI003993377A
MLLPRLPVLSVLLVLLLAAGRCTAAALLRGSGTRGDGRLEGRSMLELVGRYPRRTEATAGLSGHGVKNPERDSRSPQVPEGHPRDPRHKEKFLRHLTGPLYFNPKCRKHFHRLYHNTRECTIPAYYKRCARLLTRLANSPRCTER